ncbi:MAG: DUF433 domain-containing protein, partial [Fimbriimonadaceae bacterium]
VWKGLVMAKAESVFSNRIVVDPAILGGKPTVRGTRIPVELVLKRLSQDRDVDSLFVSYPRLTKEDMQACLKYGENLVGVASIVPMASS